MKWWQIGLIVLGVALASAQLGELMNITRESGNDVGLLVERIQRAFPSS